MIFFADSFTPPEGTLMVLAVMFFLIALANQGLGLWRKISPKAAPVQGVDVNRLPAQQQPLRVHQEDTLVGRREFDKLEKEVTGLRDKLDGVQTTLLKSDEEHAGEIHERINGLLQSMGELKGIVQRLVDAENNRARLIRKT